MNTENERRPELSLKCRANSDWGQGGGRWKEREQAWEKGELGGEYLGQLSDLRSLCINMDRLRDCPTE